jgi:hypothetical protein
MRISNLVYAALIATTLGCMDQSSEGAADNSQPQAIGSTAALEAYLATNRHTPLDRFPEDAKQRFIASVVFGKNGLASFEYTELEALSASEAQDILQLFGMERAVPFIKNVSIKTDSDRKAMLALPRRDDHDGYWCKSPGTCEARNSNICTSNC